VGQETHATAGREAGATIAGEAGAGYSPLNIPSGAEALADFGGFMYGLKPVPFT